MFNVFGSNSNNWYSLDWQKAMQAELSPSAIKDNCAIVPLSFHLQLIIALIQDLFHVKHREKSKIKELLHRIVIETSSGLSPKGTSKK